MLKRMLKFKKNNQEGAILVFSLLIMVMIIAITFAVLGIFLPKIKIASNPLKSAIALYAADSAVESCLYNLRKANQPAPRLAGIVLYLPFAEGSGTTTSDGSGSGNNGNLSGGATWSPSGRFGSAVAFDGISGLITVNDSPSLHLLNMTLEAWVNPSAINVGRRAVIFKERSGVSPPLDYGLYAADSAGSPPSGYISELSPSLNTYRAIGSSPLTTPMPGTWTHLAAVYTGNQVQLYVNGVLAGNRGTGNAVMNNASQPLHIGGNSILGEWFSGLIDEVRVYNRALSQTEIQASVPVSSGLVMGNGSTFSIYSPASGFTPSTCQEAIFDHRMVGNYQGVARSLEIYQ